MPTQVFSKFNGLWSRGPIDNTPPDHSCDCLNNEFIPGSVDTRRGIVADSVVTNTIDTAVYKPLPPFAGANVPRTIRLSSTGGNLYDPAYGPAIYTNANMTGFSLVNFFGRCYISPNDGKTGLSGVNIQVYKGAGVATRDVGGSAPTTKLDAAASATPGDIDIGTYFISFAFETDTGFITRPAPWAYIDSYGTSAWDLTSIDVGPAGTVARWIIVTRGTTFRTNLGIPPNVLEAATIPQFFVRRIANNTDTTLSTFTFFDAALTESADYLQTQFTTIASGVSLMDYKGRMVVMGQYADPSLVRISEIGEPEAISETSGFLITDPSDSTGVRAGVEFRNLLYLFKLNRGYMTEDNQEEPSTWQVVNFEKEKGTERNGIADVLDAKGSSSEGFLIATLGGLYFFNGLFSDQELTYKIRDLWLRIPGTYFDQVQVYNDPINKRLYILIPLDNSTVVDRIIFGDYRDGMTPQNIKWSLWSMGKTIKTMVLYTWMSGPLTQFHTYIAGTDAIYLFDNSNGTINSRNDDGVAIDSYYTVGPYRFTEGLSQFDRVRVRVQGDGVLLVTSKGQDLTGESSLTSITMALLPGREYAQLMNRISEQCYIKFRNATLSKYYKLNAVAIDGQFYADERPRT